MSTALDQFQQGSDPTTSDPHPITTALDQDLVELKMIADTFTHAQQARIALENRVRHHADPVFIEPAIAHYRAVEHEMELALKRAMRKAVKPSLRTWQRSARGIGELSLARFIGIVGDPGSRTLPQLRAYCGHGAPQKRHRGMSRAEAAALGNPDAKKQVYEMAYNAMRQGIRRHSTLGYVPLSSYGKLYIDRRQATRDRLHSTDCPQCLSRTGTPWRPGHSHADALRIVGKAILRDLWIAARMRP